MAGDVSVVLDQQRILVSAGLLEVIPNRLHQILIVDDAASISSLVRATILLIAARRLSISCCFRAQSSRAFASPPLPIARNSSRNLRQFT